MNHFIFSLLFGVNYPHIPSISKHPQMQCLQRIENKIESSIVHPNNVIKQNVTWNISKVNGKHEMQVLHTKRILLSRVHFEVTFLSMVLLAALVLHKFIFSAWPALSSKSSCYEGNNFNKKWWVFPAIISFDTIF